MDTRSLDRPARQDQTRGELMADFLNRRFPGLGQLRVLDVGSGKGGIATALADSVRSMIGIDIDFQNCIDSLDASDSRVAGTRSLSIVRGAAEALPFEDCTFDLVLLNGVLEWVGRHSKRPMEAQQHAISETERVLRPGGHLYLAIENRLFPASVGGDRRVERGHTHQPLVNALPRAAARALTAVLVRDRYGTYIYSYWGLRRLMSSNFVNLQFLLPLPHYHHPHAYASLDSSAEVLAAIDRLMPVASLTGRYRYTLEYDRVVATLRLNRILFPYLVVLGQKAEI